MANIIERANMRMIQAGDGFGFLVEALLQNWIAGKMRGKDLDGDAAVEAGIAGAIDFAHAAGAKWGHDFVRT
jgi:hypothetical protein